MADSVLAWRTEHDPYVRLLEGLPITSLGDYTAQGEQASAEFARGALRRLATIDRETLADKQRLFLETLEEELEVSAASAHFYWLDFAITPYRGGDIHQLVAQVLASRQITTAEDCKRYAALASDYARVLDELRAKTQGQRERGILLPRVAIPNARALHDGLRDSLRARVVPDEARLGKLSGADAASCRKNVETVVERDLQPRIAALRALLDDGYFQQAPEAVGLSQYPEGSEYYRVLIRHFTSLSLTPGEIHQLGLEQMAALDKRLDALRTELGFKGTRAEFHHLLATDPRLLARSPDDVEQRFMGYIRQIEPRIPEYFSVLPKAPYGVKRLDAADEPGMTYGYYQPPTPGEPIGNYRYNGTGLEQRSMVGAQHLIYHELIPGHHFQIALQREMTPVHPLQRYFGSNAFGEGWAEYGASLAEDMGLYSGYDLYGHLLMRSHLVARLVLDTGLNELGWSLERARAYLSEHSLQSADVVAGETLRYSTDIPGQALGYYLGYLKMRELRARAEKDLGSAFDLRAFDDALLSTGAVPLKVMEGNITRFIAARVAQAPDLTHFAAVNLVGVDIAATPAQVWKTLLDRARWNSGVVGKTRLRGPENATGEVAVYSMRNPQGQSGERLEETLLATPGERLIVRLAPRNEASTFAFADFRLRAAGTGAHLDMTLYWTDGAHGAAGSPELQKTRDEWVAATQAKMQSDLARLKAAAESAAAAGS